MVFANPPLAEPETAPGGVINKSPFEMGVTNCMYEKDRKDLRVEQFFREKKEENK